MIERSNLDDNDLIMSYLAGDGEALNELVRRYQKEAVRVAYSVLGNEDDAFDATQDAFIKVFKSLERFGGRSKFSTWLYRIVYNAAIDIGRRKRRLVQHKDIDDGELELEADSDRVGSGGPDENMLRNEREQVVRKCMAQLPYKYAVVIKLRDIEGFSYNEIAEILGTSRGNIMSRLYYGRDKLRRLISEELGEP